MRQAGQEGMDHLRGLRCEGLGFLPYYNIIVYTHTIILSYISYPHWLKWLFTPWLKKMAQNSRDKNISCTSELGTLYSSAVLNIFCVSLLSAVLPACCASSLCLVLVSFIASQSLLHNGLGCHLNALFHILVLLR